MKIPLSKNVLICLVLCLSTVFAIYILISQKQSKIAVIDVVRLFDGFTMKKELEMIAKKKLEEEGKKLDSLNHEVQLSKTRKISEDEMKGIAEYYNSAKVNLEQDYKVSNHNINEQVWKRLNPLLEDFGKRKGLQLMLGANGMGSILYTDKTSNITDEAILYINKKYAEGN